ncbi:MAG: hypothetical protein IT308_07635 [Anaerolineaceae bacterium]|nr:hypothetical protein [Anaerolineaceae bacterium]
MMDAEFAPLQITAWLRTAVISDAWLPLDGILLYQQTRRDLGAQEVTVPGGSLLEEPKGEALKGGRLPLAYVHGKEWYYRCSWAEWGPYVEGKDYWNKRFDVGFADLVDFRGRRGRVIIEQNAYKAYHMPVFYRSALWVRWYCVGDPGKIGDLLTCLTHVGKKTAQGWGQVLRWEIEPVEQDWSIWKEGRLMRGVPIWDAPDSDGVRIMQYGVRPSYWDKRNQIPLVIHE